MAGPDLGSPFFGEDPIAKAERQARKRNHWHSLILRRQRILKARGYNVPVDGNWGKVSSSAWWRFKRGKPPITAARMKRPAAVKPVVGENARDKARSFEIGSKLAPKPGVPTIGQRAVKTARERAAGVRGRGPVDLSHASAKALAAAPRRAGSNLPRDASLAEEHVATVERGVVVRQAREVEVEQANQRFQKAWRKKDDPSKWTTSDISALFADPMTRVKDWSNKPEWVRRIQSWLYAHGHSIILSGVWDAPTADAVAAEMKRREKNLQRFRATQLARKIYGPLGIKPGEKGFPVLGTAPTPQELLKIADAGGLTADTIFASLTKMLGDLKRASAWRDYQDEFLDSFLKGGPQRPEAASAFGPFLPDWMLKEMTPEQKYAAILLGFSSLGDQAAQQTDGQFGFSVVSDPGKKGDTSFEEVRAVARSASYDELVRRVNVVRQADEKAFQATMALRAINNDWFTKGVKAVVHYGLEVPGEETQDAIVSAAAALNVFEAGLSHAGRGEGFGDDAEMRRLLREENDRLQAVWGQWEKDHPVLGFGVDLIVDPLNLIPATWISKGWKLTKGGLKAAEALGIATRAATVARPVPVRILGETAATAFQLPSAYGRGVKLGAQALRQSKVGRITRSVRESADDVTRTVRTALHYGFAPSTANDAADVAAIRDSVHKMLQGLESTSPATGKTFNILDEIERFRVGAVNEMVSRFEDAVNLFSRQRVSLYAHSNRQTPSDVGSSFGATINSFVFGAEVDKYAANLARREYQRLISDIKDDLAKLSPGVDERTLEVRSLPEELHRKVMEAEVAADKVYKEAYANAGSFLGGGHFEVRKEIVDRVRDRMAVYYNAVQPALQDAIENSLHTYESGLVAAGKRKLGWEPKGLFTKTGHARGSRANSTLHLRDILRQTFDDLDLEFGPSLEAASNLPSVQKFRSDRLAEIEEEFALREQALVQREHEIVQANEELRQSLLGERLVVLRRAASGGGDVDVQSEAQRLGVKISHSFGADAEESFFDLLASVPQGDVPQGVSHRRLTERFDIESRETLPLSSPREVFLWASRPGRPDGALVLSRADDGSWGVNFVYVDPEFRRRGVATSLYRAAADAGIPVEAASGRAGSTMTPEGILLRESRVGSSLPSYNTALRRGETVQGAARRFADENGLDLSRFTLEEGESVRRFPVLISKKDSGTVIFGRDAQEFLARARNGEIDASGYLLGEARIGASGKATSLAHDLVDLSTGELRYEPRSFEGGAAPEDAKFRKAIRDLKEINKKIATMQERRRAAGRAKAAHVKEQGWTPEDVKRLNQLRRSKRKLIEQNPASRAYFVRGTAKRAVTRHVESILHRTVGDAVAAERAVLHEEKAAAISQVDNEARDLAALHSDTQTHSTVFVKNEDYGRVFTQDEYDDFLGMTMENRSNSVTQWAARRRAAADMTDDAINAAVERAMQKEEDLVTAWFKPQGDGTFKMVSKGRRVPAIYARHHFRAYDDALKGRHPVLTAEDVPADIKRILSIAATPAEGATGAVGAAERIAALISGARPYPVRPRFVEEDVGGVVKGRSKVFERALRNRVGLPAGTRLASGAAEWGRILDAIGRSGWEYRDLGGSAPSSFVARYDQYHALLKVASTHVYPRLTLRQGALIRALKEAQSGPLREINNLLEMGRSLFVFSVLPGRPAALFRNVFDSVLKILVTGLHDPRYWIAQGATKGELAARRKLAAISGDARAATSYDVFGHRSAVDAVRRLTGATDDAEAVARSRGKDISPTAAENATESVTNIFQLGINELDQMVRLSVGPKYADAVATTFRHVFNTAFWGRPIEEVRKALRINAVDVRDEVIFGVQTVLRDGVPQKMLPREKLSLKDWAAIEGVGERELDDWIKQVTSDPTKLNDVSDPRFVLMSHTADVMWDLMVGRVEGWLRRGLYRSEYAKAFKRTDDAIQAHTAGMRAIDHSLFDYSKTTNLDENLKHLIPFYFFWRRNLAFWATSAIQKPWLPAAVVKYDGMMEEVNSDEPSWSRRYLRIPFLNDAVSKLPVANWILGAGGGFEVGTDPLSWVSAAPLYRAFKGENPTLPPDKSGLPFISGLIDGMSDFGLSLSPWFRKPAELAGLVNYRAWQSMFPQTSVVDAFSTRFLHEMFPQGLNFEEALQDDLFKVIGVGLNAHELREQRIEEWVQTEMAAQVERGEPLDRAAAEKKVRQFVYLQTIFAFASGAYLRHLDPAQLQLYKIQQQLVEDDIDFLDLPENEQRAYRLFIRRKLNPGAFDEYVKTIPKIEGYYAIEDFDEGQKFLQENPEVIPHVMPERTGKPVFRGDALKNVGMVVDTNLVFDVQKAFEGVGLKDPGVRDRVSNYFVTPELKEFWARNDTPSERRDRMIQGEVYRHLRGLRGEYFAIPEGDHGARSRYLEQNPILGHWFTVNDEGSDDLKDVLNYVNNDLREVYFDFVEKKDWDGAAEYLKRFPRMFEFTKAENRVSEDGIWLPDEIGTKHADDYLRALPHLKHYYALQATNKEAAYKWLQAGTPAAKLVLAYFHDWGKKGTSAKARAFLEAQPFIERYYALKRRDKAAADAWLRGGSEGAKLVLAFFEKYGSKTKGQHAKDYLAIKDKLDWFFNKLPDEGEFRGYYSKWGWVYESDDPTALKIRDFFERYGNKGGMGQQARDFGVVKKQLKHYFSLRDDGKDAEADAYLHSEEGRDVRAYFKKYGKANAAARKWGDWVRSENPEVNRRLMFWKTYFELPPDQRPGFVHRRAEHYGVFIWGRDADQARHDKEQDYVRKAKKRHLTKKTALYLRVKPLLDLFHTLDDRDQKILLRLNPDVREYFDTYASGPHTGDKKLDKKVETYFDLPPDSLERADFLRSNPEVQDYFDEKNPADAAMHNLLEVYFQIPSGKERSRFANQHPEISDYFDRKREEKSLLTEELRVFDETDPHLAELRERAQYVIVHAADVMWARLRGDSATRLAGDDLLVRRERDEDARKSRRSTL